jgi:putative inorganic carbon (hco3(-)) transporter
VSVFYAEAGRNRFHLSLLPASVWLLTTIILGLLTATQPLDVLIISLAIVALALMAAISPFTMLMALLILAPLRTLIATEAPQQLPFDIGQMALIGLLISWFFHRILHKQPIVRLVWTPLYLPLGALIVVLGISAFSASSLGAWLSEWLKWVQILIAIILVLDSYGKDGWKWVVFGLILSGVANSLVGIYQFLGGSGALHLAINGRFFRAFGTFGQPNPFGGFMGLLAPVAMMLALAYSLRLWQHWRSTNRLPYLLLLPALFYSLSCVIFITGLGVSWSRGAWLGFVASVAILALALPRKLWHSIALLGIVAGSIGLLWFTGLLPASIVSRINSATEEYFTFTEVRGVIITSENYPVVERLAHWQAAVNMARGNPWLGIGLGNYEVVYHDYLLLNWHLSLGHAHNYYLNILAETGIIGLLAYGKAWLGIMWLTWRTRHHPDLLARFVAVGLLGTWTYLAIHSLFDNLYVNNLFLHIGFMIGVLVLLYNQTCKHYKVSI